jgi:putative spermidine/putrescine transport system substrate-binding protein
MRHVGLGQVHLGKALAVILVALAAVWVPSAGGQEAVTLTYASYGGALKDAEVKAFLEPYMKLHSNIKVLYDIIDRAKLIAMVESNNVTWDVADVGNDFGLAAHEKYLEKIDCSVVPCADLQPDKYPTTGYRVAWSVSGVGLGYNTTKMPAGKTPQSWADFFDLQKFPGKRSSMNDASSFVLEVALVADGVPANKVYPLDIQRGLRKWDAIKSEVKFTDNFQGCAEAVATGDAVMGLCWTGRFATMRKNGAPVEIQWNGTTLNGGYFAIPKGSKHVKEAMQFIAYMVSPEPCARISEYIPYGCPNVKSSAYVKASVKPNLGTSHAATAIFINDMYWDQHRDELFKTWQAWLTK